MCKLNRDYAFQQHVTFFLIKSVTWVVIARRTIKVQLFIMFVLSRKVDCPHNYWDSDCSEKQIFHVNKRYGKREEKISNFLTHLWEP